MQKTKSSTHSQTNGNKNERTLVGVAVKKYSFSYSTTVCPGSSDPFYVVTYYIQWITTSWTYSMYVYEKKNTVSETEILC